MGVAIGTFTIKMLGIGLVALGLPNAVRDIITGLFLLVLLAISANEFLIERNKQNKEAKVLADAEYAEKQDTIK